MSNNEAGIFGNIFEVMILVNYAFVIRKAMLEDAAAIREIMQESFKKYMEHVGLEGTMEALEETIDDIKQDILNKEVFIALVDDIPVGTIRVQIHQDGTAYISRFGVKLDYHNAGIGKALMSTVDKLLISRNIKKAYLHTASKYKDLVLFYYGRGFYVDSTTRDRGYVRALMVKEY